jgi:hypothetical protein
MNTGWPETVPILNGRDIYQGGLWSETGKTCCLLGWAHVTFSQYSMSQFVVLAKMRQILARYHKNGSIMNFNDNNSRKKSALLWNKTMHELGYTEIIDGKSHGISTS